MKLAFFSNILNHHQVSLCDEFYKLYGEDFTFVELSSQLNDERRRMGFMAYDRGYKISYTSEPDLANRLAIEAEVAIMGAESFQFLKLRLKHNATGVTFSYSERWLKKGLKNVLSPRISRQIALYVHRGWKRKWYMLCASGFLSEDLRRIGIFKNRRYKWGYFPKYSIVPLPSKKSFETVRILWVGRFLDWKHPEYMLFLAEQLNNAGYYFELTMIGDGVEREKIQVAFESLNSPYGKIRLLGNMPNDKVIKEMSRSDIFCFTSDRREGWGAVLGEAMANGCCPVASSDAGATPFLIKDGINGLIYQSEDESDFIEKVKYLTGHRKECQKMGMEARKTMIDHWSAEIAAKNFYRLAKSKLGLIPAPHFEDEP